MKKNFYVDDCLKSVCDEEEGVEVAKNLPKLLSRGGFHLTKWASNSGKVFDSIPGSEIASVVKDLDFVQPIMQWALGTSWDVVADVFTFNVTIKERPPIGMIQYQINILSAGTFGLKNFRRLNGFGPQDGSNLPH